jgi:Clp amino terminal domain, pathogenicity island component
LFERYTERARRSIFFARYEASRFRSLEITSEELLLGILREDKSVVARLDRGALEAIRKELEELAGPSGQQVATSVDMPLSQESKRALQYGAEEAEALNHKHIDAPHLVLGLLRIHESVAASLLRKHGIEYERYREIVRQTSFEEAGEETARERPLERAAAWHQAEPIAPLAASLGSMIQALQQLVDNTAARLKDGHTYGDQKLKRNPWTRKEALGHLIDWAIAHQRWLTRALMESKLVASGYPDEGMVTIQHYADFSWQEIVDLWVSLNRLLVHVLLRVPEDKVNVSCRIGIAEPVPLSGLMTAYLEHCQDFAGQILARLD